MSQPDPEIIAGMVASMHDLFGPNALRAARTTRDHLRGSKDEERAAEWAAVVEILAQDAARPPARRQQLREPGLHPWGDAG